MSRQKIDNLRTKIDRDSALRVELTPSGKNFEAPLGAMLQSPASQIDIKNLPLGRNPSQINVGSSQPSEEKQPAYPKVNGGWMPPVQSQLPTESTTQIDPSQYGIYSGCSSPDEHSRQLKQRVEPFASANPSGLDPDPNTNSQTYSLNNSGVSKITRATSGDHNRVRVR